MYTVCHRFALKWWYNLYSSPTSCSFRHGVSDSLRRCQLSSDHLKTQSTVDSLGFRVRGKAWCFTSIILFVVYIRRKISHQIDTYMANSASLPRAAHSAGIPPGALSARPPPPSVYGNAISHIPHCYPPRLPPWALG